MDDFETSRECGDLCMSPTLAIVGFQRFAALHVCFGFLVLHNSGVQYSLFFSFIGYDRSLNSDRESSCVLFSLEFCSQLAVAAFPLSPSLA